MKQSIIIQARMSSTRLPGKVMLNLAGKPVLLHVYERCKNAKVDDVIIATTTNKSDDIIEEFCKKNNILYFRGSEEDVLDRYYQCAKKFKVDIIVRVTSDCPLISSEIIDEGIEKFRAEKVDYLTNVSLRSFPRGLDFEVFSFDTLEKDYNLAKKKHEREHVTPFIYSNPSLFKIGIFLAHEKIRRPDMRLCLDTKEDMELLEIIYKELYSEDTIQLEKVIQFLTKNPDLIKLNQDSEKEHLERSKEVKQSFTK
ncbi:acylneuraminate cytidylyltransferase [Candidatus Pacearchaeota archaeon CG10_big_fil_rev_8_21_14_0_10_34_76]|nr:MAG: acylneuraminate cytidylyltransferase [Candidatus Pacearchaeota archaeon CG10_big_fil_rev_8_21_14_0_10_34_76]